MRGVPEHDSWKQGEEVNIEVIIPVYNEQRSLPLNVPRVVNYLAQQRFGSIVTIADNGSTDDTPKVSRDLCERYPVSVHYRRLEVKGRGLALRTCWLESTADIIGYMDVDLSTELSVTPIAIAALQHGFDLVTAGRLSQASETQRCLKREIASQLYNQLTRAMFHTRIYDHQCGFKFLNREIAIRLLPKVVNNQWFFDTELILLALREHCRILEVPAAWKEGETSTVQLAQYGMECVTGLVRVWKGN